MIGLIDTASLEKWQRLCVIPRFSTRSLDIGQALLITSKSSDGFLSGMVTATLACMGTSMVNSLDGVVISVFVCGSCCALVEVAVNFFRSARQQLAFNESEARRTMEEKTCGSMRCAL